jgi:hypothetical protein
LHAVIEKDREQARRLNLALLQVGNEAIQCNLKLQVIFVPIDPDRGAEASRFARPQIVPLAQAAKHFRRQRFFLARARELRSCHPLLRHS